MCRSGNSLQDGSAAKFTEGSCGAAEGRIRTAYDVFRSLLLASVLQAASYAGLTLSCAAFSHRCTFFCRQQLCIAVILHSCTRLHAVAASRDRYQPLQPLLAQQPA